jgi:Arm DNA-binding domain/Phage integrase, N-terminal SAM-like domain
MVKITKRVVEAADAREKDYLIWDDELPGFGIRVFSSGKRSYVIQCRTGGRHVATQLDFTEHGPETARREASVQLGRVAGGDDPVEDRQLDHRAITVKELCTRYLADLQAGLILGKGGQPMKASTIVTDTGRIERHIIPLIGPRRVKDLTQTDINKVLKDIMAGKTRVSVKTKKLLVDDVLFGPVRLAFRLMGELPWRDD